MSNINEKTYIPLYWVAGALPFVIAAIFWMASVDSKATTANDETSRIKDLVIDVRERTIRIEEYLKNHR